MEEVAGRRPPGMKRGGSVFELVSSITRNTPEQLRPASRSSTPSIAKRKAGEDDGGHLGPWNRTPEAKQEEVEDVGGFDHVAKHTVEVLAEELGKLQDEGDEYTAKVEFQVKRRQEHREGYERAKRDIRKQKEKLKELRTGDKSRKALQSFIRQLEHRIYVGKKRKSEFETKISSLKEQVDNGRKDILFQDQRIESLEQELTGKKGDVARLVEESNSAYEERETALAEISELETKHKLLSEAFEKEWKVLGQIMKDKEENYQKKLTRMKLGSTNATKEMESSIIAKFREDEVKLKKAVIAGNWVTAKSRITTKINNEKAHTFEEAFLKIQNVTGVHSLEDLMEYMAKAEDRNFRAFNHLAEMNNEISELEMTISSLQQQIEECHNQTSIFSHFKRQVIRELQDKFNKANHETDGLQGTLQEFTEKINSYKPFVRDIFNLIDCSMFPVPSVLDLDNLSDTEMLQCLGIIEQRTNEILHLFTCIATVARVKARALDSYQTFHTADVDISMLGATSAPTESPAQRRKSQLFASITGSGENAKPSNSRKNPNAAIVGPQHPRGSSHINITPPDLAAFEGKEEEDAEFGGLFPGERDPEVPVHRADLDNEWLLQQN